MPVSGPNKSGPYLLAAVIAAALIVAAWALWPFGTDMRRKEANRLPGGKVSAVPPESGKKSSVSIVPPKYALRYSLGGHNSWVEAVAFSPDGKMLASASEPINLWEVSSGRLIRALHHTGDAARVTFSPDGRWLASAGCAYGGPIRLWDVATGLNIAKLPNPGNNCTTALDFSPDGRLLASGSNLYDLSTRDELWMLEREISFSSYYGIAFSRDGRWFAASGLDKATIWDTGNWKTRRTLEHSGGFINPVAMNPDGSILALWESSSGTVAVWRLNDGRKIQSLRIITETPSTDVRSLAFSPDGRLLACTTSRGAILWDTGTWTELQELGPRVNSVAFSPDGRWLAAGSDVKPRVWL